MVRRFWQSEIFEVWTQYLAAGVAAVPGGVAYLLLLDRSVRETSAFRVGLALAVALGLAAWFAVGCALRAHRTQQVLSTPTNVAAIAIAVTAKASIRYTPIPVFMTRDVESEVFLPGCVRSTGSTAAILRAQYK